MTTVLRLEIVRAYRSMRLLGLTTSTVGNVSARTTTDAMLITPTRVHPDDLRAHHLVTIDLDASEVPAMASLEWPLHAAIYRARPDIAAIAHTHSPSATARSFDTAPLIVTTEERAYLGLDQINVATSAPAGTPELADRAVAALGARPAVLLERHGVVAGGSSPRHAVDLCHTVEHVAAIALLTGAASAPDRQEARRQPRRNLRASPHAR
jgi:L-fuculose-phosphate aldolase